MSAKRPESARPIGALRANGCGCLRLGGADDLRVPRVRREIPEPPAGIIAQPAGLLRIRGDVLLQHAERVVLVAEREVGEGADECELPSPVDRRVALGATRDVART